jgi:hypothetical protein
MLAWSTITWRMKNFVRSSLRAIFARPRLTIAVMATALGAPLLFYGLLPFGHDVPQHLNWYKAFRQSFWSGDLYPRWLAGANAGLGSPIFFVYGPLPFWIAALLRVVVPHPLAHRYVLPEFTVAAWLALPASGWACYLWLRTMVSERPALLATILYMAVPYHLWVDLYVRGDIPECWALVWMPLTLYFVNGAAHKRPRAELWLAICYALLITTHLFTVLLFSLLPPAYALLIAPAGGRTRVLAKTAAGMALGVGVAAIYLFPALRHEAYIPASRLISLPQYDYARHFLPLDRMPEWTGFLPRMAWLTLDTIAVAACFAALGWGSPHRRQLLFWGVVCCISFVMMLSVSAVIWRHAPMLRKIQLPWRFNVVLCLGVAAVAAIGLAEIEKRLPALQVAVAIAAAFFLVGWGAAYGNIWWQYQQQKSHIPDRDSVALAEDRLRYVWLRCTPAELYTVEGLRRMAAEHPLAAFADQGDRVRVAGFRDRNITVQTQSARGGSLIVRQFYYPGWMAKNGTGSSLPVSPSYPEGLIQVRAPAGDGVIYLVLAADAVERVSQLISAACLLIIGLLFGTAAWRRVREPRETSAATSRYPDAAKI